MACGSSAFSDTKAIEDFVLCSAKPNSAVVSKFLDVPSTVQGYHRACSLSATLSAC